jgi:hypothetical protein
MAELENATQTDGQPSAGSGWLDDTSEGELMDCKGFVEQQVEELRRTVGNQIAVNALSGGVDSSVVTALGHRALGNQLKTVFVDNALMREGEPQRVVQAFGAMGIPVDLIDARTEFLAALKGRRKAERHYHNFLPDCFRPPGATVGRQVSAAWHHPYRY